MQTFSNYFTMHKLRACHKVLLPIQYQLITAFCAHGKIVIMYVTFSMDDDDDTALVLISNSYVHM